jgi:hypothetical protein
MNDKTKKQIEELTCNRQKFNDFVYTPFEKAIVELNNRQNNLKLDEYINKILNEDVPEIMRGKKSMVLFRHIATPNYEIRRFLTAADALEVLHPIIFEYTADKFTNRNEWKYSLGRISLHKGMNRKKEQIFECKNVINFNQSNNKPIHSINTHWNQSLVDFHHEIFTKGYPHLKDSIFDLSDWLHKFGTTAKDYYKAFLCLFLKHGILFENFLIYGEELPFTQEVILPMIIKITEETGLKPLIVALEPTEIEGDQFWLAHPYQQKSFIDERMKE